LRRKQGRGDWEDSEDLEIRPRGTARSSTFAGDLASGTASTTGEYGEDDEWDVERAVQNRVVQIMFTVPKEKLRVVNQDVADDKSEVASLKSRKGSNRSVQESEMPAISGEQTPLVEDVEEKEAEINEPSPLGKGKGKGKGRVKEIVEKIEERNSDDGI
jgi:hypothetical protein